MYNWKIREENKRFLLFNRGEMREMSKWCGGKYDFLYLPMVMIYVDNYDAYIWKYEIDSCHSYS